MKEEGKEGKKQGREEGRKQGMKLGRQEESRKEFFRSSPAGWLLLQLGDPVGSQLTRRCALPANPYIFRVASSSVSACFSSTTRTIKNNDDSNNDNKNSSELFYSQLLSATIPTAALLSATLATLPELHATPKRPLQV